ncbi:MAG TPA: hypothetical protein VFF27_17255 [Bacteroidia bacterium]|nr:hypothetical protein [Bacteroidia bacterium]
MHKKAKSSWIYSGWFDTFFILSPPFWCLLLISIFPHFFQANENEPEWFWLLLVVCIDVGHVYSTIYRTYFDKQAILKNKTLFYLSPLLIYIIGVVLYSMDALLFWRAMAYLAVFHFIRQQYGFMRIYSRNEQQPAVSRRIDTIVIYASTIYPLLYWHFSGQQLFNWFIEGDFVYLNEPAVIPFLTVAYVILLAIYIAKEIYFFVRHHSFNLPKNILIAGTALSWYFGIVYFKGDLTFTLLNVVSHGIPYYGLVWAHSNKKSKTELQQASWLKNLFKPQFILFFLLLLILFAYTEELIWDGFIWKDHMGVFPSSSSLPDITENKLLMTVCIPLFALPQLMHYFIDGFIWKMRSDQFNWFRFFK